MEVKMTKNTNEIIRYDIDEDTGIWSGKDKHLRGHMEDNNQDNVYIIHKLNKLGYRYDTETSIYLKERLNAERFAYFMTSLMAFEK